MENLSKKTNNFMRGLKFNQRIYSRRYGCYYTVEDGRIAASLSFNIPLDDVLTAFPLDIKASLKSQTKDHFTKTEIK